MLAFHSFSSLGNNVGIGRVNDEMLDSIETLIRDEPVSSIRELNARLRMMLPGAPHVCDGAIRVAVKKKLGLPLEQIRKQTITANSDGTLDLRQEYAAKFIADLQHQELVFIDETGMNLWLSRTRGWSLIGERCVFEVDTQRGGNFTVVAAISPSHGLLHHQTSESGFTRVAFSQFLDELSAIIGPDNEFIFVLDNAQVHKRVIPRYPTHSIQFLPPYSPWLNPIEFTFSPFKAEVKRRIGALQAPIANLHLAARSRNDLEDIEAQ